MLCPFLSATGLRRNFSFFARRLLQKSDLFINHVILHLIVIQLISSFSFVVLLLDVALVVGWFASVDNDDYSSASINSESQQLDAQKIIGVLNRKRRSDFFGYL